MTQLVNKANIANNNDVCQSPFASMNTSVSVLQRYDHTVSRISSRSAAVQSFPNFLKIGSCAKFPPISSRSAAVQSFLKTGSCAKFPWFPQDWQLWKVSLIFSRLAAVQSFPHFRKVGSSAKFSWFPQDLHLCKAVINSKFHERLTGWRPGTSLLHVTGQKHQVVHEIMVN